MDYHPDLPSFTKVHCTQAQWAHLDTRSGGKHAVSAEARLWGRRGGERHRDGFRGTHSLLDDIGLYLNQWMKVEISGLLLSLFADTFNS